MEESAAQPRRTRNAVDYVLKPLDTARLAKVVTKLQALGHSVPPSQRDALRALSEPERQDKGAKLEWLHVATGHQVRLTHVDDVMFFESDTKYTRVVANEVDGLIRASLKELLAQLPPAFVQIHRSAVVNRHFVRAVHRVDDNVELEIKGLTRRHHCRPLRSTSFQASSLSTPGRPSVKPGFTPIARPRRRGSRSMTAPSCSNQDALACWSRDQTLASRASTSRCCRP